jgi:hypothetical protein
MELALFAISALLQESWPSSRRLGWQDKQSGPGPPSGRSTPGAAGLINAVGEGVRVLSSAGALGAAFFLPTAIVPPLLVTHALIFLILIRWHITQPNTTSSDRMAAP